MQIEILTIFPELFDGFLKCSLVRRAIQDSLISINTTDIRDFAEGPHQRVDDAPYGGGAGMVMKPEPLALAIQSVKARLPLASVVLLSPGGEPFVQEIASEFSSQEQLILVCGRYEGIDQRVIDTFVDREISIGDYVLMGGEIPAMAVIEATVRLIDGVVGNPDSVSDESFSPSANCDAVLEGPQYTRPPVFMDQAVPEVLLSGDHRKVREWRLEQSRQRTQSRRPDLTSKKADR